MKIAFVGKGGSGKTTISSLFTLFLTSIEKPVLAIDSDINQHMGFELGFTKEELISVPSMGQDEKFVYSYLAGSNDMANFIRTTPPNTMSNTLVFNEPNVISQKYELSKNGIRFIRTGLPDKDSVGKQCYHVNMGVLQACINHIVDMQDEYVLVDLTAGIDTVSSGMFTSYDIVYVIVEPTKKSVDVFNDYIALVKESGYESCIYPIANKIKSMDDLEYIQSQIGILPQVYFYENTLFGREEAYSQKIDSSLKDSLNSLYEHIKNHTKDHDGILDRITKLHNYKTKKA
jgi:CO dehydrogenase maturation factor